MQHLNFDRRVNMKNIISSLLGFIVFIGSASCYAGPTCANPIGVWKNQLGSTLTISTLDASTGKLSGTYISPSGTAGSSVELTGWINNFAPITGNTVTAIAFSVQWGKYGSITSWTGTCENNASSDEKIKIPTIKTIWNLVRSSSQYSWDHILTNSDVFTPR